MLDNSVLDNSVLDNSVTLARTRWTLSLLALFLVLLGVVVVTRPFIQPLGWSIIIVLSTWPLYRRLKSLIPNRPSISALIMVVGIALLSAAAIVPILTSLTSEAEKAVSGALHFLENTELTIPQVVARIPLVGQTLYERLSSLIHDRSALIALIANYQQALVGLARSAAEGIVTILVTMLMSLLIAYFLFRDGMLLGHQVKVAAAKIGGKRFLRLLTAVQRTIKGAVYGVLLTALAQGTLAGLGFIAAGAPVPILLGLATMGASLIPFAPPLIYTPVCLFLLADGQYITALLLALWCVGVVSSVDNFLRPYFISQATKMPIIISLFGVIGGLISFGMIGIFLGPVIIAVALALWHELVDSSLPDAIKEGRSGMQSS